MHIGSLTFGLTLGIKRNIVSFLSIAALALSGCTEREVQVSMLSKDFKANSDFKITNAANETDILSEASATSLPLEISCSNAVTEIAIQKVNSLEWTDIKSIDASATLDCPSKGTAQVSIPVSDIAPYSVPTVAGDVREDFKLRYATKNKLSEITYYERTYFVVFPAPALAVTAAPINATNSASYTVTGTCAVHGVSVEISGPFTASTVCTSNTFSATQPVDVGVADGSVEIKAKMNDSVSSYRAFNETTKNVLVDRALPTVSITYPTDNAVFNMSTPEADLYVAGNCSEAGQSVSVIIGGTVGPVVSCGADNKFKTLFGSTFPSGTSVATAAHQDAAGNVANSTGVNVTYDLSVSGAFSIAGLTAPAGAVGAATNKITTQSFRVHYGESTGAATYIVKIKDSGGSTEVCPQQTISAPTLYADFTYHATNCNLVHNGSYKVEVSALKANGNKKEASNSPYSFTVDYPKPMISSITTLTAAGTYKAGEVIQVTVLFDSAIDVTGNPELSLNMAGVKVSTSVSGTGNSLIFNYVVAPGHNTSKLAIASLSGSIVSTLGAAADLTIPASVLNGRTIEIDTAAPAAFTISGITPDTGGAPGNTLTTANFRAYYVLSSGASFYDVKIMDAAGTTQICPTVTVNAPTNYADFLRSGSCLLNQGGSYKVDVTARDGVGNQSVATNNGYPFTVVYPSVTITSVTTTSATGIYALGATIPISVKFSEPVTVTSTPQLTLNFGGIQVGMSSQSASDTLEFNYVVGSGQNTLQLGISSLAGTITGTSTGVGATLSLPSPILQSKVLRIDTRPPDAVTVSVGTIPFTVSGTPTFGFTLPTTVTTDEPDAGQLTAQWQLFDSTNTTPVTSVLTALSGGSITASLVAATTYILRLTIRDVVGNSTVVLKSFKTYTCPANFLYVNNPHKPHTPFCVARTEAKLGGDGKPAFTDAGLPWGNITVTSAAAQCDSLGTGYDLLNNSQWNSIADIVVRDSRNWSNGTNTSWNSVFMGNASPTKGISIINQSDTCWPFSCGTEPLTRRYHHIGEQVIWDFAGNVWEWVGTDTQAYNSLDFYVSYYYSASGMHTNYGTTTISCTDYYQGNYCGFGYLDFYASEDGNGVVLSSRVARGGGYQSGNKAGIFAAKRVPANHTGVDADYGFRCSYSGPSIP